MSLYQVPAFSLILDFLLFSNSYRSVTFHYRFQKTHSICPIDPSIHQENLWRYSTHYLCILSLFQVSVFFPSIIDFFKFISIRNFSLHISKNLSFCPHIINVFCPCTKFLSFPLQFLIFFYFFSNSYRLVIFHYRFQKTLSICPVDLFIHQDNFWGYSKHY